MRYYNIGKVLRESFDVDLFSLIDEEISDSDLKKARDDYCEVYFDKIPKWESYLNTFLGLFKPLPLQCSYYYSAKINRRIEKLVREKKYDLVLCNQIRTYEYIKEVPCLKAIDFVDSVSLNYSSSKHAGASFVWKILFFIERKRLKKYESIIPNKVDFSFATSERDVLNIRKLSGSDNVMVVPNGVNEKLFFQASSQIQDGMISFLGKMDYSPNIEAVVHFVDRIFPLIKAKMPHVKFFIIGACPAPRVLRLAQEHQDVFVTGFVPDPYTLMSQSQICVAPMVSGAGIQNKVLEAMALGKCVVTTSYGSGGIAHAECEVHFVVEDDPSFFASQVVDLIRNEKRRRMLEENAENLIKKHYRWQGVAGGMIRHLQDILNPSFRK